MSNTELEGTAPAMTPATQAVLNQLAAVDWLQRAPEMLAKALQTEGPEGDAQVRAIIAACPDLLGKAVVGRDQHLPLYFALQARAWGKVALLIELGASTTGIFQYLLDHGTTFVIPELEMVLEAQFAAWLEATPTPHYALKKLLERDRPDWAWRYCTYKLQKGQLLLNDEHVRKFMFAQTEKLAELLALPNLEWPSLVHQRMPLTSWQVIAKNRPELLEAADSDGENLLHQRGLEWVQDVAHLLPREQLVRMLEQRWYNSALGLTPWQYALLERGHEYAEALWNLVRVMQLPIDLAKQKTKGRMSSLHLAFAGMRNGVDIAFIRWLTFATCLKPTVRGGGYKAYEMTDNRNLLK